ncbi:unnamed protein product [Hymenolepis diminuta]|uniref:TCTP domain-containing protein n=1 Tax=Hymenolepis diminuta TaxID=6216 RepID=A0A0R3SHF3_HYMDI|nr:unnamed protein product [Hymenolepis diminuta]VUZ40951.1 unnamed protein product [Hymenolepis diminuta]
MEPLSKVKQLDYDRSLIGAAHLIHPQMAEDFMKFLKEEKEHQQSEKIELKPGCQPDVNACLREVAKEFMYFVQETDPDLAKIIEKDIKKYIQNTIKESKKALLASPNENVSQEFLDFLKETDPELANYLGLYDENETSGGTEKPGLKYETDFLSLEKSHCGVNQW